MSTDYWGSIDYECVDVTGSTNTDLLERVRHEGLSSVIVRRALTQTLGRGTRGRVWHGSNDCLMFSVGIPIGKDLRIISAVTLVIGAHMVLALRERGIEAQIKWPNDILLNGKKLAGILVEVAKGPDQNYVLVVGVGLNLKNPSIQSEYGASALSDVLQDSELDADRWIKILAPNILNAVQEVITEGLERTQLLWDTIAAYTNQTVSVVEENEAPYDAVMVGIDDQGRLLVRIGSKVKSLLSGMVSIRLKNEFID